MTQEVRIPKANKIELFGDRDSRIWIDGHLEKVEDDVPVAQITVEQDDVFIELTLTRPMIDELYLELEALRSVHTAERFVVCREGVEDIPGKIAEVGSLQPLGTQVLPVTFNYDTSKVMGYAFDFHREMVSETEAEISFLVKFTDRNLELLVERKDVQPGIFASNVVEGLRPKKRENDPDQAMIVEATIRHISFFPVSGNPDRFKRFYSE